MVVDKSNNFFDFFVLGILSSVDHFQECYCHRNLRFLKKAFFVTRAVYKQEKVVGIILFLFCKKFYNFQFGIVLKPVVFENFSKTNFFIYQVRFILNFFYQNICKTNLK